MFNSIISSTDSMISAGTSLASMGVAVVLGVLISVCYMFTQKKGSYTKDYIVAVAVLPVIVSLVIMLVGNSVARAFSLAGAFALVRFRSAPGSAKDIAVVFCHGNRTGMRTRISCVRSGGSGYHMYCAYSSLQDFLR